MSADPHRDGRLRRAGASPARAAGALVLLHGRGGSAEDMLGLAEALALPDLALYAPEAAGRSWWPASFLAPMADLEPWLGSALRAAGRAVEAAAADGIAPARIHLLGFSQGACLALEALARRGGPIGAAFGLSGGLVGTEDADGPPDPALYNARPKRFEETGRLDGAPVYLSCHERDPHIPLARVEKSAQVLAGLGASVETRIKPGAGHGVDEDDIAAIRRSLNRPADRSGV